MFRYFCCNKSILKRADCHQGSVLATRNPLVVNCVCTDSLTMYNHCTGIIVIRFAPRGDAQLDAEPDEPVKNAAMITIIDHLPHNLLQA